jgi:hypothetical protein
VVVSEDRGSRVSDIRSFVAEVIGELERRPVLEDPLEAVRWLGEITAVLEGDDAAAKRRLACRLICLGLPELQGAAAEELLEEVVAGAGIALAEMNAVIDRTDGALVAFDEEPLTQEDLAGIAETVADALARGDAREIQTVTCALAGVVLADPRPDQTTSDALQAAAEAVEDALSYAEGLTLRGDNPVSI